MSEGAELGNLHVSKCRDSEAIRVLGRFVFILAALCLHCGAWTLCCYMLASLVVALRFFLLWKHGL